MYVKNIIAAVTIVLFAGQASAAVLMPNIAPDAHSACNCPNNCKHKNGDSCKFYSNGNVLQGICQFDGSTLNCHA